MSQSSLSLPLLPHLALPTLSLPKPAIVVTLDKHDDDSGRALGKPTSHPLALEQAAAARATKVFERVKATVETVLARNADATNASKLLAELRRETAAIADTKEQLAWVAQHVQAIAQFNAQQLTRSVGVTVPAALDARMRRKLTTLALEGVRGVPRDTVARIAPVVRRAIKEGQRGKAFELEVREQLGVSSKKARRIAIGSVLRANSALTEHRHKQLGVVEYVWRSSPDKLTRYWHRKLNGKRFRYDKPPEGGGGGPHDHGNPGSADTCRCQSIPVLPDKLKAPRLKR